MGDLVIVALVGFFAAMVDGALGMGFGPTSSSLLLSTGISPGAVSTSVNLAKVVTVSSPACRTWRLRNIDRRLVAHWRSRGHRAGDRRHRARQRRRRRAATVHSPCSWASSACASWCASRCRYVARLAVPGASIGARRAERRRRGRRRRHERPDRRLGPVVTPYLLHRGWRRATWSVASTRPRSPSPSSPPAACWRCWAVTSCALGRDRGDAARRRRRRPFAAYVVRFISPPPPRSRRRRAACCSPGPGAGYDEGPAREPLARLRRRGRGGRARRVATTAERRRRPASEDLAVVAAEER